MYPHKSGIYLRKMDEDDLPLLFDLKAESWFGTHSTLIVNETDQRRWYNSLTYRDLYMIAEFGGFPIGVACYTSIDHVNRSLNLSGSIFAKYRKPDIVKAAFGAGLDFAFEIKNVFRVQAEVLEYHVPAQMLEIEYLGFTVEGRRRKAVYKSGRYYDSIMLGMLAEDWYNHPRVKGYGTSCNTIIDPEQCDKFIERANKILAKYQSLARAGIDEIAPPPQE